jgi:hypothetical protein
MTIDESLGWIFAICCVIVLVWTLYTFTFGLQVDPVINNGYGHGEGSPTNQNDTYIVCNGTDCEVTTSPWIIVGNGVEAGEP